MANKEYYENKNAVVTGGASGIGLALAETMLSYGARRVVLADVNEAGLKEEVPRLDSAHPAKVLGIHCDVTKEKDVQAMMRQAATFGDGSIDLLFNNAGAGFVGLFDELGNKDWEKAFALNFYGALYGIRAVLPIMRAQGGGHIVDVVSGIAFYPMAYQAQYAATKAALNALTLALRYELWDENIRVTSTTPGVALTGIWEGSGVEPPSGAHTAEESARNILAGVAENQRLVLADEDVSSARTGFAPEDAEGVDEYLLSVARQRREGHAAV